MADPTSGEYWYDLVIQSTDPENPQTTTPRTFRLFLKGVDGSDNPVLKYLSDVGGLTLLVTLADGVISASAPFDIPYVTEYGTLVASELVADPGNEYVQVLKNLRLGTVSTGVRTLKWYLGTNGGEVDIEPGLPDIAATTQSLNLCDYDRILAKGVSVDLNSTAKQTLYTVPTGYSCIITKVVERNASAAVTTAVGSYGFNAGASDVVASFNVFDDLTGTGVYTIKEPGRASVKGSSTNTFGYKGSVAEGSARTMVVDVFGYLL